MPNLTPRRMRAAVLVEPGHVELREVPVPEPDPGELIIRVEAALTCGTDLKTFRRGHPLLPFPAPFGHEFSGIVSAAGQGVRAFREGDAIAAVPTAPCGECRLCARGRDSLCPAAIGRIALGGFADFMRLPAHIVETNAFQRPAMVEPEIAAALEPLACVVHGAGRVELAGESVLIVGDGPIALLFLQVARLRGASRVMVAGRHASRLDVARALGADRVADDRDEALRAAVRDWSDGAGAGVVIECVGSAQSWEDAPSFAAAGGVVLLFGGCPAGARATFDTYRIHYEEVELKGAFHYGRADVRGAWDLLTRDVVRIAPLVTHEVPLDRLDEALRLALSREAIKVVVRP